MDIFVGYPVGVPQEKSVKKSSITRISLKVGDLLTGAYNAARMNQTDIAERAGMSTVTLQKKLAGKAPITTTDLVLIAAAIPGAKAGDILEEAVTQLGGYGALMSEATSTNSISEKKRKQAEAQAMATEEIEELAASAANHEDQESKKSRTP